ncbi:MULTISPECIES: c-type cytochrome [Hyphomonas]|uniref:Cytochrome c domain-containing protein n=1 Tax=Hyphomonas adhaerens TaxID=81029 RepID=A0A3B9GXQ6_9PROT|nr:MULTISPECIES: hypothetical protein [Hyphomonas]MBB40371.1 hypothetical protein [Hyphomonas sp.]HAE27222.1 hypothetical protein [Hyphomonas adhaerens]|tara:strand:+ start:4858 stop:5202 length:345 start_codon:yes stop_codon:yes gene_type:complete
MSRLPAALTMIALLTPLLLGACSSTQTETAKSDLNPATDISTAAVLSLACSGCHGATNGAITSLDSRSAAELRGALLRYRSDEDGGSVMHRMMKGYSEPDIEAISAYLAGDVSE